MGDDDDRPGEAAQPVLQPRAGRRRRGGWSARRAAARSARRAACRPAARAPARRPRAAPAAWRGRGGRWPARGAPRRARPPGPSRRAPRSAPARARSAPAWRATCRPRPAAPSSARSSPRTVHTSPRPAPSSSPSVVRGVRRLLRQPADALAGAGRDARRDRDGRRRPAAAAASTCPRRWGRRARRARRRRARTRGPSKSGAPSCAFVRSDACNMESSCVVREAGGLGAGKRGGHTRGRPVDARRHPRHRTPEPTRSCLAGRRSCAVAAYFTAAQRSARRRAPRSAATSPAQPQARVTPAPPWP